MLCVHYRRELGWGHGAMRLRGDGGGRAIIDDSGSAN